MLDRYFLAHPRLVNETYVEHAGAALKVAGRLFGASLAATAHAIVPCLFVTTASSTIKALHSEIAARTKST